MQSVAVFAALLFLCLLGPGAVRHFTGGLFEEFRAPIDELPSRLYDLEKFWSLHSNSKRALIEAGRDLARLNAAYELKVSENSSLKDTLLRYEAIFNFPSHEKFNSVVARVVRRDLSAWWQQMTVRRGSLDGVAVGDAVVYAGGIVGRVSEVSLNTAVVELLSSRKFRLAAHFEGSDEPVIYQGAGALSFHDPCGEVSDVPSNLSASAARPLRLVTSSLAGTFPEGLVIGDVVSLNTDSSALFKEGKVVLRADLSALREVVILTKVLPEEQEDAPRAGSGVGEGS